MVWFIIWLLGWTATWTYAYYESYSQYVDRNREWYTVVALSALLWPLFWGHVLYVELKYWLTWR